MLNGPEADQPAGLPPDPRKSQFHQLGGLVVNPAGQKEVDFGPVEPCMPALSFTNVVDLLGQFSAHPTMNEPPCRRGCVAEVDPGVDRGPEVGPGNREMQGRRQQFLPDAPGYLVNPSLG